MKYVLVLLLLIAFTGCTQYAKLILGIKKQKVEQQEALLVKVKKITPSDNNIPVKHLCFKPANIDISPEDTVQLSCALMFFNRLPSGVMLFNKEGKRIDYFNEEAGDNICLGKTEDVLMRLPQEQALLSTFDTLHLPEVFARLRPLAQEIPLQTPEIGSFDYVAVFPWANYFKQTQRNLKKEMEILSKRKDLKIKYYTVNCDVAEDWKADLKFEKFNLNIERD